MICNMCQGAGVYKFLVGKDGPVKYYMEYPCPDCGGHDIVHCSEGLCEQENA